MDGQAEDSHYYTNIEIPERETRALSSDPTGVAAPRSLPWEVVASHLSVAAAVPFSERQVFLTFGTQEVASVSGIKGEMALQTLAFHLWREREREDARARTSRQSGRQRERRKESYNIYLYKVLKQVHKGLSLSQKAVGVVGSFVKDVFERIADEAAPAKRSSKHSTISSREMQTALRPLLPGEIGKHAVSEATKAIIRDTFRQ
ncbi:late histone H2B.2.2-like [Ursus arctos]|uniref:late histone H2B.2.2-like n=2 Tax=Ursus arctos TaxID=9644 RepID=UPI000E6DFBCA|nr:late histone H2B.2.2-like [Ursus arctos]